MTNEKKQQIIELLKDKEVADSIGVMSEGLVKLFESIPADEPEEKKPYDPGLWFPKADERYYEAYVGKDTIYGLSVGAENGVAYPDNCWKTSERAIEVGKKIKFLMLVERIRDTLQHEGAVPNGFWVIVFNEGDFEYAEIEDVARIAGIKSLNTLNSRKDKPGNWTLGQLVHIAAYFNRPVEWLLADHSKEGT